MNWQAGILGPAFVGEPLGFEIRGAAILPNNPYGSAGGLVVEVRVSEENAGLLLAAAEWATTELRSQLGGEPEWEALDSARVALEQVLADSDESGLIDVSLGVGQIAVLTGAASLCAQSGGLDPFLASEMVAGARTLQAAAAMGPVAREMGLTCRNRMPAAPFSLN
ncbi:MAG TPA: hypothetical protein VFN57_07060 [Thermomicrobiaceae bacterium]|nr:hypothetical protein [Thermomicrobiaceae bacterium]